MQDGQAMQCHCINWCYKALVTRMVFAYCRFSPHWSSNVRFSTPWISPRNTPALWWPDCCRQNASTTVMSTGEGSVQCVPTASADIKHLCEEFIISAETAKDVYSSDATAVSIVTRQRLAGQLTTADLTAASAALGTLHKSTPTFSQVTKCNFLYWERPKGHRFALQSIISSLEAKLWVDRHRANCPKHLKICTKYIYIYSIYQFSAAYLCKIAMCVCKMQSFIPYKSEITSWHLCPLFFPAFKVCLPNAVFLFTEISRETVDADW